jgi:nucleoside-diphosphate kinase
LCARIFHIELNFCFEDRGLAVEKTLIIIKPHAVARGLAGEFLSRFERMEMRIAAIRVVKGERSLWERFYPSDEVWFRNVGGKTLEDAKARGLDVKARLGTDDPLAIGTLVKGWLVDHMSKGPAIAAVLEGNEAQQKVRAACGATMPMTGRPGRMAVVVYDAAYRPGGQSGKGVRRPNEFLADSTGQNSQGKSP